MTLLIAVELLELLVFATLAVVSYLQWRRRGGRSAGWLALAIGILGMVVPISWIAPPSATGASAEVLRRVVVILLALFPYCLYRFTSTLAPGSRRMERLAPVGTVLAVLGAFVLPSVTKPEGGWQWWYVLYALVFTVQWTLLSIAAVVRLWGAGRRQPAVVQRRMRLLASATVVLNLALFLVIGSGGEGSYGAALAIQAGGLVSGVLLLVGFVPPRGLRRRWRRREVDAFRTAEAALMGADTVERVTAIMLPHAAGLVGARAAVVVDEAGEVKGRHGIGEAGAATAAARLPVPAGPDGDALMLDGLVAVPLRRGWLAVMTTPLAPFFGPEEVALLLTLAHLAGLALDRAELFDRERLGRLALADREYQLAEAQRTAQIGSYTWEPSTGTVTWSDEMARVLGFSADAVPDSKAQAFASRIHPDDRARVLEAWRAAPTASGPTTIVYRILLPDGETRWIQGRSRPVVDDSGAVVRLVGTLQDITDAKRAEEAIAFQATHDALTRLPNRLLFMDRLSHALARRLGHPSGLAVLFLDLDRFKWLNDSLGHAAGDEVLLQVAARLREALRPADTLARFGGDEFVVLCEDLASEAEAEAMAVRLRAVLARPVAVGGEETLLTATVGIAYAPPVDGGETAEALVRDADAAMYRAKELGRDRYEVFDANTRLLALARHETVNALRRGIGRGELVVYYQPQVDLTTGTVVGVEALVRWNHPQRGLLGPYEFIPLAEESGLIVPLGVKVLEAACAQVVAWNGREGVPSRLSLSVNLAARQLLAPGVSEVVEGVLAASGLEPGRLCLEITESVLLDDGEASARALRQLKTLGVRIGVDDFGTGFSALTYLKRFPVDVLKIDRSFVVGLGLQREDRAIVASVVDLAHAFGLTTVAEGVETADQLAELRALGCERAQGYLWSRPMAPDLAAEWVAAHTHTRQLSPARTAPSVAGRRFRVLLVDDDPALRAVLRLVVEDTDDFEVVAEAEDGRQAIAVARHYRPDVVVLDLAMPGIGGLEALPLIRGVAPDAKVIVMSALDPAGFAPAALRQGAVAYLDKGRGPAEIVDALSAILSRATAG